MLELYPYLQAIQQMETQFEFLRCALEGLSEKRTNDFFATKHKLEISDFRSRIEKLSAMGLDKSALDLTLQHTEKTLKKKWGGEKRELYRKQFVPDDLNKSELLLLVALFEGFLKDAYRALVYAEPRRAFASSGKQASLKEMFVDNVEEWRKSKFFQEIADDEVDRFDHLSFKDRIVALTKRYEFKFEEKEVKVAHELIERRHKISHCWTDRDEVKHVSPQDLGDARRVFNSIPLRLARQASGKYPKHFKN